MTQGNFSAQLDDVGGIIATGRVIANFAWQHMKTATLLRDHVYRLETDHRSRSIGAFFEEIRAYASACVMTTAASLEALINELFIAHTSALRARLSHFEDEFWGTLNTAGTARRGGIEGFPVLKKYQHALDLMNAGRFVETSSPYRETAMLIGFRNALTHHKPVWDSQRQREADLVTELSGQYALSPFLGSGNDFLSEQCMSADCTSWCILTALRFIAEFESRTHIESDKFAAIKALAQPRP